MKNYKFYLIIIPLIFSFILGFIISEELIFRRIDCFYSGESEVSEERCSEFQDGWEDCDLVERKVINISCT